MKIAVFGATGRTDWTIIRAPMLTEAPASGKVKTGYLGTGPGPRLSRADLAAFVLAQIQSGQYLCQAPVISN